MVCWVVTEGTAQDRFERASKALGATPSVRHLSSILVEITAELPAEWTGAIRLLLRQGVAPELLTADLVEAAAAKLQSK
jgi:hypothetical protein